ncbi:MAG TPA: aldo/keto reductase [Planctomycetota bacterium]|jgi:predicted aldo/keto reductase-like oxidoreductase
MSDPNVSRRDFLGKSALLVGAAGVAGKAVAAEPPKQPPPEKILNFNKDMEYRRLGRTDLWISAVCLGGHWKRINEAIGGGFQGGNWLGIDMNFEPFHKNRYDTVTRMIEKGLNYIDSCTRPECLTYGRALKGRRDKMYLGFSWYEEEMRNPKFRTEETLLGTLEKAMKACNLEYVDLWRIVMNEQSSKHTKAEIEEMIKALDKAKQQGKARFTGFSSHDRPHIKTMIETYPKTIDVVVTPYTAKTKEMPKDSVFEAIKQHDVGVFGIKPFSSGALFKGSGLPNDPNYEADCKIARLAIRNILANPLITAPIPGLICPEQVDNMAAAVKERRELDTAELKVLDKAYADSWSRLPEHYEWLKDFEQV